MLRTLDILASCKILLLIFLLAYLNESECLCVCLYRVGQKTWYFTFVHIFVNYRSIFKIILLADSADNLQ